MPKSFICGALYPTGGSYMSYHIGRILAHHYGYELFDVQFAPPERTLFAYDTPISSVSVGQMEQMITDDDLLILNPSHCEYLFGLRLPGRKIMYAQGFRKSLAMDCHCDLYISVSSLVSKYLHTLYDITSPVIPAFIQSDQMPKTSRWHDRPAGSILVCAKDGSADHQNVYRYLFNQLQQKAPDINISNLLDGTKLTRLQFLEAIGSVRYILNLSLAEGFGLVPLEAMAMGTAVIGLDGLAGRDYMRSGHNCLVESMTSLNTLPDTIVNAVRDETLAYQCTQNGQVTAAQYGYAPFKEAWIHRLSLFLEREPDHA